MLSLTTMAGLSGTYALYAALVNPLIQPPLPGPDDHVGGHVTPPPRNSVLVAERFLSAAPWAAQAQYQLRTKEAFVFFENWKRVDGNEAVRFWPFAIVWIHNDRALREGPITFVSESAMVKFATKFEITNDPGRVIAAALEGTTTVRGPNNLAVDGRNFSYSESAMRIWSDEPLTFEYGENSGRSVGMQVDLLATTTPDDNSLAVRGMQAVRLKRDVQMKLVSDSTPIGRGLGEPDASKTSEPTRATVTCEGAFHYDTEKMVARYERNVNVVTPTTPEHDDTLVADELEITFAPSQAKPEADQPMVASESTEPPPTPETGDFNSFETNLEFRRMFAAGPNVELRSAERDVTAIVNRLDYDAETRVVQLASDERVRVLNNGSELRSPQITLVHAREGGELESVHCLGAGQMRHRDPETGEVDLEARWDERMRIRPDDDDPNQQVLELEGKALVRQVAERSAMQANYIRLWFEQSKGEDTTPANGGDDERLRGIEPRKLLALEDVTMVGDNTKATTRRLEVWFEQSDEAGTPIRTSAFWPSFDVAPQSGKPLISQSLAAVDDPTASPRGAEPTPRPKDGPIEFTADLVRIRAVAGASTGKDAGTASEADDPNTGLEVREVWSFGNVDVRQEHRDGKPPLHVTGQRLHVVVPERNHEILHVYGAEEAADELVPAHVRDRGVHMEGNAIHLDRGTNRSWVAGRGLLQLPVTQTIDGKKLDEPQLLDVWWSERMDFDGEVATFVGDVRTVLEDDRIRCGRMTVRLTDRIDFTDASGSDRRRADTARAGSSERRPEIATVTCLDGVTLEGHQYEDSKLVGVRRAKFWQFDLDQKTGDTVARGPGWLVLWRRGGHGAKLGAAPNVRANGRAKADRSEWEYTRIEFEGRTAGNVHGRNTKFEGLVEITYGPVDKPLDVVDADALPENGGWMRSETLDLHHHEETEQRPAYFTAFGAGNVYLRGREFFARADEVTYDESKDLYVLRAKGDRNATIWREKPTGDGYDVAPAKRMEFIPSRNSLKLDRASGIDGSG